MAYIFSNNDLREIYDELVAGGTSSATAANQVLEIAQLTLLNGKDFATQTTLAAVLAKLIAAPATEAKQDTGNTSLNNIDGKLYSEKGNEIRGYVEAITTNTAQDIIAAQTGAYSYVNAILVTNSHATQGTIVRIQDDTGNVMWSGYAAPVNGGFTVTFPTPLKSSTTNTKIQAICGTTGASVTVSISGFKSA